jgi:HSP20 family protein
MLVPSRRQRHLWTMPDPLEAFFEEATSTPSPNQSLMKSDVQETDENYLFTIDLPGFKKDNVNIETKDGYLSINAAQESEHEEKEKDGTFIRKERFSGKCSRTFYLGEDVLDDKITAKFEDGTLKITVPKKEEQKKLAEKKTIDIEG